MNFLTAFLAILPFMVRAHHNDTFTEANNNFAAAIYKQLAKTETGNIIESPLSAELVLTLLDLGCKGDSAEELRKALYLPDDDEKIKSEVKSLLSQSKSKCNSSLVLNLANKIYVQENFTIEESFEDVAVDVFGADAETIDFQNSEQAAETINSWVEEQTNDTIQDLIAPNSLSDSTVVVLVNALYLKTAWKTPFSTSKTRQADFYKTSTDVVQVETLYEDKKSFKYYESVELNAQLLELDGEGGVSVVIVLPSEKEGLAQLEENVTTIVTSSFQFQQTLLKVSLPKFKFDLQIDFTSILKDLGVTKIFDKTEADLSGIAGQKGDLIVSQVTQKAYIDLNEGGIVAAAATAIGISTTSVVLNQKSFIADHPFLFLIKYQEAILFIGRVNDPKYESGR